MGARKKFDIHRATVEKALKLLGAANGRLVILIDDVDRMNKTELLSLLRLVRTVADLPFITLVIAMDDECVRDILSQAVSEGYGQGYLDKIVQAPMHVPLPERDAIKNELVAQLEVTLDATGYSLPTDLTPNPFLDPVELRQLVSLIRTPRDLARYINGVRVLLLAGINPDVHVTDAALIEALRIFHPDVYDRVRRHKQFLTATWNYGHISSGDREKERAARAEEFNIIIRGQARDSLETKAEESVRKLLELLFGDVTDPNNHRDRTSDAVERRIRSPKFFDNYFRYAPRPGTVTRREMENLLKQILNCASEGNTSGIAEILASEFTGQHESAEELMFQELEHSMRDVSPQEIERIGEGIIKANERLPPALSVRLLTQALGVTMSFRFGSNEEWDEGKTELTTRKLLQMATSHFSTIQTYKLLSQQRTHSSNISFKEAEIAWLQRIDEEIREGDFFEEPRETESIPDSVYAFAHAIQLIGNFGKESPVSPEDF